MSSPRPFQRASTKHIPSAPLLLTLFAACSSTPAAVPTAPANPQGAAAGTGAPAKPVLEVVADQPVPDGGAAPAAFAAPDEDGFRELLGTDWELPPHSERYYCLRKTMPDTVYVHAFRGDSPLGTHHVNLTMSEQPDREPDGISECDLGTVGTHNAFGGGPGTEPLFLPNGIAVKFEVGSQLLLNLHLFNAGDEPQRGRSGMSIQVMTEGEVQDLADFLLAGTMALDVPPGRSISTGQCTITRPATVFAVFPHMHQTGVAMQVVAHTALKGDVVLFDGPYDFDTQLMYPLDMLTLQEGDVVDISCTFDNGTDRTLHWGGSTEDEMCNSGLMRFPAGGASFCVR